MDEHKSRSRTRFRERKMMEELMYGIMPRAKIEAFSNARPENMFNIPKRVF